MSTLIDLIHELTESGQLHFDSKDRDKMDYNGSLGDVVETVKHGLESENDLTLFMYAPRMLIGVINYGLENNQDDDVRLKQEVECVILDIFKGNYEEASAKLSEIEFSKEQLSTPVVESEDTVSWRANHPQPNYDLLYYLENLDIDYIFLDGHDGYRPGFLIAAALDVPAYGVKIDDRGSGSKPKLLKGESDVIRGLLDNKKVLVYGEDIATGGSCYNLMEFVEMNSSPKQIFVGATVYITPGAGDEVILRPDFFGEEKTTFS